MSVLRDFLTSRPLLVGWIALLVASVAVWAWDVRTRNRAIPSLMKCVWAATILYSGPIGLALYWWAGRTQIPSDTLARRGVRSTCHCYSGCGAGEIAGVFVAAGLLSLGNAWVSGITFALAYVAGYALTVGPLVQEGMPFGQAMIDTLWTETASITVMEVVAIGVDLLLARGATIGEPLFWSSLFISLSIGLLAAFPVNVLLVHQGVKEGMMNPRSYGS